MPNPKTVPGPSMTLDEIDKALAVCNAASEGPWETRAYGVYSPHTDCRRVVRIFTDASMPDDRAFAAHARTGYPAALLALKAAMEQIEGMKQWGLALAIIAANEPIGSSAHTIAMEGISKAAAHAKAGKTQEVPNG